MICLHIRLLIACRNAIHLSIPSKLIYHDVEAEKSNGHQWKSEESCDLCNQPQSMNRTGTSPKVESGKCNKARYLPSFGLVPSILPENDILSPLTNQVLPAHSSDCFVTFDLCRLRLHLHFVPPCQLHFQTTSLTFPFTNITLRHYYLYLCQSLQFELYVFLKSVTSVSCLFFRIPHSLPDSSSPSAST